MKKYDVVIIGAGPAGLEAAKVLAENDKKVLVLEKNSVIGKKVCAGGLTTKDFELGISPEIADHQYKKVILRTPLSIATIKASKPFVATIERENLGKYLVKEDRLKGVEIELNKKVTEIKRHSLTVEDGSEIEFDYLIGADGGNSIVREYLKLEKEKVLVAFHYKVPKKYNDMELIFDANLFGAGYAWIFSHEEFTSIGAGFHNNGDHQNYQESFQKWAESRNIVLDDDWYEAFVINYDYQGHEFGNIFLAGDAAGFASGLTGEGIYFAMISGSEIALKILDKNYDTPKIKKILAIKRDHEQLLDLLKKNKALSQFLYSFGGLVFKTHLLDKKLVNAFS